MALVTSYTDALTIIGSILAITVPLTGFIIDYFHKKPKHEHEDVVVSTKPNDSLNVAKIPQMELEIQELKRKTNELDETIEKNQEDSEKQLDREIERMEARFDKITDLLLKILSK